MGSHACTSLNRTKTMQYEYIHGYQSNNIEINLTKIFVKIINNDQWIYIRDYLTLK